MNLDLYLFNLIHGFARKNKQLDFVGIFFARYLPYILVIFLAIFAIAIKNVWIFLGPVLVGLAARFILNEAIYMFYKRKRPAEALALAPLIKPPNYPSFPSGHATFFFSISFALLFFNIPLAICFIIASFFISIGRIFCGVHWPSDILAGFCTGVIPSIIMALLLNHKI